ncbi:DUF2393 domain-containing protein [Helicobacter mehlei]|uniref:DUF2393 domain-containing protein n=1 Tax=Helicobacter mehlei TaxID=2316080 RepID=A0A553UZS7_9HELI|nr:DUF2393 domain-containing protein [Helicobacter mehlei]TSA85726.1 DUF2393 domain-containing protein [Helicobacter mehlei]
MESILWSIQEHLRIFWNYTSLFAVVIFCLHYAFFLCFFILGLAVRGYIATFLYMLSFICLFGAPFGVHYLLDQQLFKIHAQVEQAYAFTYTDAFEARVQITNEGRMTIHQCALRLDVLKPASNKLQEFLYQWLFEHTYIQTFKVVLAPKQTHLFSLSIEHYPYKQTPFKLSSACY